MPKDRPSGCGSQDEREPWWWTVGIGLTIFFMGMAAGSSLILFVSRP